LCKNFYPQRFRKIKSIIVALLQSLPSELLDSKREANFLKLVQLHQGFPTFLGSRTTWTPRIVNAYHFLQNN